MPRSVGEVPIIPFLRKRARERRGEGEGEELRYAHEELRYAHEELRYAHEELLCIVSSRVHCNQLHTWYMYDNVQIKIVRSSTAIPW